MLRSFIQNTSIVISLCLTLACPAKEIFQFYPEYQVREFPYRSPTARYIERYGWENIADGIKSHGVTMVHRNLFDRITHREERGFIGYHGSTQEFRIYQDIIRLIIEELCKLPIREDFHFFRIPGDPLYYYKNLGDWGMQPYNPTYFLCMNYAIYGNHVNRGSSSYFYFTANSSANPTNYEIKLKSLFEWLEIDEKMIAHLFAIGRKHIGLENGVIYQIFDMSHFNPAKAYYALADNQCIAYLANEKFSEVVGGTQASTFSNQIRMLMGNATTLNPHSSLIIKRFDKLSPEITEAYMNELQEAVKSLMFSQEKAEEYAQELLDLWEA